jgi:hypothetical protein
LHETRNSIFTTLTFTRDTDIRTTWLKVNETSNRYVQRVRRTVDSCEYLKVYEEHKDGYPHIHVLFLFRNLHYPYNNSRWLPTNVFKKLKSAWTHGLSDHQSPIANSSHSTLSYVLKYINKSSSSSHLWSQILKPNPDYTPPTNDLGYPITSIKYAAYHKMFIHHKTLLDRTDIKLHKIKLLTWSRGFIPLYLTTIKS